MTFINRFSERFIAVASKEVSYAEVSRSIDHLISGRSCGNDGLYAEHFKYAGVPCAMHLSLRFSLFLKYSVLAHALLDVVLIPLVAEWIKRRTLTRNR